MHFIKNSIKTALFACLISTLLFTSCSKEEAIAPVEEISTTQEVNKHLAFIDFELADVILVLSDDLGNLIGGAKVKIRKTEFPRRQYVRWTNGNGIANFRKIAQGTYELSIRKQGQLLNVLSVTQTEEGEAFVTVSSSLE